MDIGKVLGFIQKTLGVDVREDGQFAEAKGRVPAIFRQTFDMYGWLLEGVRCVLLYPKEKTAGVPVMMKRADGVGQVTNRRSVLILDSLDSMNRRQLIYNKVPFVVPGKQLYLPFLGLLLSERGVGIKKGVRMMSPSSQFLILYHLQRESLEGHSLVRISERLKYSLKTISLASSELSSLRLCTLESRHGNVKYLQFFDQGKALWQAAKGFMKTPVAKTYYVPKSVISNLPGAVLSYDSALEYYTFISAPSNKSYAVDKAFAKALDQVDKSLSPFEGSVRLELWKYSPSAIMENEYIDPLSMALCYKEEDDERVQGEIDRMIQDKIW